jgi:hypothetical protein
MAWLFSLSPETAFAILCGLGRTDQGINEIEVSADEQRTVVGDWLPITFVGKQVAQELTNARFTVHVSVP